MGIHTQHRKLSVVEHSVWHRTEVQYGVHSTGVTGSMQSDRVLSSVLSSSKLVNSARFNTVFCPENYRKLRKNWYWYYDCRILTAVFVNGMLCNDYKSDRFESPVYEGKENSRKLAMFLLHIGKTQESLHLHYREQWTSDTRSNEHLITVVLWFLVHFWNSLFPIPKVNC